MSNTVKQLGFIPTNRGEFDTTGQTKYYKDNVVQYRNGSYICSPVGYSTSNPTAYTTDAPYQDGDTELNANWKLMASVGLVDEEPVAGSENLVKSRGVVEKCAFVENKANDSLDITDPDGNIVVRFDGGIKTKDFDSTFDATEEKRGMMSTSDKTKLNGIENGAEKNNMELSDSDIDFSLSDDNNNVLAEFYEGHVRTKNFDSKKTQKKIEGIQESIVQISNNGFVEMYAYAEGDSSNDDDTHFYGWKDHICAWQRAINACDGVTRTKIYCQGGIKVTDVADMFKYGNFWNVINIPNGKNNIELIGQGKEKTRVEISLPNNLDINTYQYYQTMYINGNNCVIKDMTIALKNGRYPLHLDRSGGNTMNGYNVTFENCEFVHYMNEKSGMWSNAPFGLGISSGMHLITRRCGFVAPTRPLYLHDNINHDEGFLWDIIDCYCNNFATTDALKGVFTIQMLGGGCDGIINVVNMDCGSTPELYVIDQLNNSVTAGKPKESYVANLFTRITGQSFNPVGYYVKNVNANGNLVDDSLNYPNAGVLRFKSSTAGNSSTVRFNKTSSAFDVLIKGQNLATDFTVPQSPIVYADNYVYRDGKTSSLLSTNGYAHGCLAISKNSDVASLHARLGNCSVTTFELGVIVDGTEQTIIFNQDYSSMSDADIITAINAQLSGATADIFIWGAEYYPEIKPSFRILTNKAKGVIPNGSVVSFKNGTLDLATSDDEVFGVAIDDIYYNNDGRVLTKCLLSTSANDRFHVNVTLTEGAYRYGIDSNAGVLVAKADGIFTADYNGFLTLNK